jgi:hypothetical protein
MISSTSMRQRRSAAAVAALLAIMAAAVLALALSRDSEAGDGQARYSDRYSVLASSEAAGVQVIDPADANSATARAKMRRATASAPIVFATGPIDTGRIRRAEAPRASRGVSGGSNVSGTWVAPSSNGGVCFLLTVGDDKGTGGTCSQAGAVGNGSISVIFGNGTNSVAKGETILAGAVPDEVTAVQIDLADGTRTTVPVVDNAFTFDTAVRLVRYSLVTDDGPGEPTSVLGDPNA